jgi:hypothetical protein
MLRQIWLKKLWRRVFIKKPTSAPVEVKPARRLTDAEYEALFFLLLAEVEQGLTRGGVKGLLAVNGVTEAELIIWLRGFGERLLVADAPNQELGRRLVQLRDVGMDLGEVAYQIGVQLSNGFEDLNSQLIPKNQLTLTEIQQLLNPTTAIVYWHLSPYALHTFILTHNTQPVILQSLSQRLHDFETWKENWNQEYNNYRKSEDIQVGENHIWRNNLTKKLEELKEILDINTIENIISNFPSLQEGTKGDNSVENLILIPHRDLHRFQLHALFSDKFTITYLPSAQIGINLRKINSNPTPINQLPILSIENPNHEGYGSLPYAEIESAAINQLFPISQQLAQNQDFFT